MKSRKSESNSHHTISDLLEAQKNRFESSMESMREEVRYWKTKSDSKAIRTSNSCSSLVVVDERLSGLQEQAMKMEAMNETLRTSLDKVLHVVAEKEKEVQMSLNHVQEKNSEIENLVLHVKELEGKIALMCGHTNSKQKIHYIQNLHEENRKLKLVRYKYNMNDMYMQHDDCRLITHTFYTGLIQMPVVDMIRRIKRDYLTIL